MRFWGCGIIGGLTSCLFWLQQLPVDTQATRSTASLRATSLTSTMWSSLSAIPVMWLRGPLGPSAWPAGSGVTCYPPAEVSPPSFCTWPQVLLPFDPAAKASRFSPSMILTQMGKTESRGESYMRIFSTPRHSHVCPCEDFITGYISTANRVCLSK